MSTSNNGDAEKAVLGSLLKDNDLAPKIRSLITAQDFYGWANQQIYTAIIVLREKQYPVDVVTLANFLRQKLEEIGGCAYLGELLEAAPSPRNAPIYAEIVRDKSRQRQLERLGHKIADRARNPDGPIQSVIASTEDELRALRETGNNQPALDEIDAGDLAASQETYHLAYLPLLGLEGYIVRGWSHLLAGYPRAGKTELMAACCRDWLAMGERILYFTEEPRSIWAHRLASSPDDAWRGMRLIFALGSDRLAIMERMRVGTETIVVLDALRNLGLIPFDECDNTEVARQLNPWIAAARKHQKTLILTHHMRKGAGEHGEGIAGGHAFLGIVDIALELRHDNAPSRRLVRAHARIIQPLELIYERREDGTMQALGSPKSVELAEVRRRVLEAMEEDWLKTSEIREKMEDPKPSIPHLRQALTEEAKAGTVERDPPVSAGPATGRTVRWRRAGLT